jgi:hypothetical protein
MIKLLSLVKIKCQSIVGFDAKLNYFRQKTFEIKKIDYLCTLKKNKDTKMYAIVEIAGKQYKAEAGRFLYVDRLEGNDGDKITFDKVLLLDNGGKVTVGAPTTGNAFIAPEPDNAIGFDEETCRWIEPELNLEAASE